MFDFDRWMEIFKECNIDPDFYALRQRDLDEVLPWSHIDVGVSENYLKSELKKASEGITTHDCREGCTGCGINGLGDVKCIK